MSNAFASNNNETEEFDDPVIVILSCGGNAVFDDHGLTDDEIFDAVVFIEYFYCEDGKDLIWQVF